MPMKEYSTVASIKIIQASMALLMLVVGGKQLEDFHCPQPSELPGVFLHGTHMAVLCRQVITALSPHRRTQKPRFELKLSPKAKPEDGFCSLMPTKHLLTGNK